MNNYENSDYPCVSIIIPARNAGDTIKECLESINRLNFPKEKIETIIVDNGSIDSTVEIAKTYGAKILSEPLLNVGALRNAGVKAASGEIIAHTDSDCILPCDWLTKALKVLDKHEVGAVGGGYNVPNDASLLEKAWVSTQKREVRETNYLPGGNFILQKKTFDKIGGFDENILAGEDDELSLKIRSFGLKLISCKSCYVIHLGYPKSLIMILKRQIWHGKSAIELSSKTAGMLIVTLIFLSGISSILALSLTRCTNTAAWVTSLLLFVSMPVALASKKIYRQHKIKAINFLVLIVIYFFFLFGRVLGLFYSLKKCMKSVLKK